MLFRSLYPSDGLFPDHAPEHLAQSKTGHLYPQDPDSYRIGASQYIQCESGKFYTKRIERLQIRNSENEIGKTWPEEGGGPDDNCYVIEDNFLVYGKSDQEMKEIAKNIFGKITDIAYMPFNCDMIGNPCIEVGDAIRIPTKYEIVESYVLQRTLKGIQALRDEIRADGVEKYGDKVNGVQKSIIQLKGKTNVLVRTVDETRSELKNLESSTESRFIQTAEKIEQEVLARTEEGVEIKASLSLKINKDDDGTIISLIEGSADRIHFNADNFFTVDSPNFKIDESGNAEFSGNVVGAKVSASSISGGDITGASINNGNGTFSVDENGHVKMTSAEITGKIVGSEISGSKISGSEVVGGKVTGATIKAKEGIYLQYTNANTIPPISGEYVFARTGYGYESEVGGLSNGAYLELVTPSGSAAIAVGLMGMGGGNFGSMAYFPDGAIISNAEIRNIILTYSMENSFIAEGEEGTRNPHEAQVFAKVFGAFACVYGKYRFHEHRAGENVDIKVGNSGDEHIPKWANVEVCTSYKGSPFVFILQTNGTLRVINASKTDIFATGDDANSYITINFRFDFFRA